MIFTTLKYIGLGLAASFVYTGILVKQHTLGSLATVTNNDVYPADLYPNGTDLELPLGTMRYWQFGNEDGNRVVLVHGISTGPSVFTKLARDLADNGHHVLVYDLWGRGFSDAPAVDYDEALYTSQLAMLLQKVGWTQTDVIGLSLGGGIATSFTAFYPEVVNKLVLIAPVGLFHTYPPIAKFVQLPFVYFFITTQPYMRPVLNRAVERFAKGARSKGVELDQETTEAIQLVTKLAMYQFTHHPGFLRAFLGTIVKFPFTTLQERYEKVGKDGKETLIIWGNKDTTVPFGLHKDAQELIPQAKLIVYPNHGHDAVLTSWRSINEEIETFLISQ